LALLDLPLGDLVDRILAGLPARSILAAGRTCRALAEPTCHIEPWRRSARNALGPAACALHESSAAAGRSEEEPEGLFTLSWWRELALAVDAGLAVRWDHSLSRNIGHSWRDRVLVESCAHCSVAVGELVLLIGGRRTYAPTSSVVVVNCRTMRAWPAGLASDSQVPPPRFRHAACKIAPEEPGGMERVLVLGGVYVAREGIVTCPSSEALVLHILDPEARTVRWSTQRLEGDAPGGGAALFHHVLFAFDGGRKAAAWGGDTLEVGSETAGAMEAAGRECAARAAFVFEIDVRAWTIHRRPTSGPSPGHRSLAEGVVYGDKLVVVGGTVDPKPLRAHEVGRLASMAPLVLDIRTWTWLPGLCSPEDPCCPSARSRLAVERRGKWLLGYGGRDDDGQMLGDVFLLDLDTFAWREPLVLGHQGANCPNVCAGALCGGAVFGGMDDTSAIVAKADALLFTVPSPTKEPSKGASSGEEPGEGASSGEQPSEGSPAASSDPEGAAP